MRTRPSRFEELLAIVHCQDQEAAVAYAERVRQGVENLVFGEVLTGFGATVRAGVALHRCGDAFDAVIDRADGNLYKAKQTGRNRVVPGS